MKLAIARGVLAFFGTMVFILLAMNSVLKDMSFVQGVRALLFWGFIVGGVTFAWTWYQIVEEEHKLKNAERRRALKDDTSDQAS